MLSVVAFGKGTMVDRKEGHKQIILAWALGRTMPLLFYLDHFHFKKEEEVILLMGIMAPSRQIHARHASSPKAFVISPSGFQRKKTRVGSKRKMVVCWCCYLSDQTEY